MEDVGRAQMYCAIGSLSAESQALAPIPQLRYCNDVSNIELVRPPNAFDCKTEMDSGSTWGLIARAVWKERIFTLALRKDRVSAHLLLNSRLFEAVQHDGFGGRSPRDFPSKEPYFYTQFIVLVMKIKVLNRNEADFTRERAQDVQKVRGTYISAAASDS